MFSPTLFPEYFHNVKATLSNGNTVFVSYGDSSIKIYDERERKILKNINLDSTEDIAAIAAIGTHHVIAGGRFYYNTLRIYNLEKGQLEKKFSQYDDGVNAIAVLHDGNVVVGGAVFNAKLRIYNPQTGGLVRSFPQHDSVNSISVLDDGNISVRGLCRSNNAKVYDPADGTLLANQNCESDLQRIVP